ncbi:MAG TPA: cellulase family glycosylhydrolase [Chloroflexota bacterium]|nr:cellulase family glycosylhydrolase [Chloroflexota bacterium]
MTIRSLARRLLPRLVLLSLALSTAACGSLPFFKSGPGDAKGVGVQAHLWGYPDTTDRDLGLARDAGFTWVKVNFPWAYMEGDAKGRFEWNEPDRIVDAVQRANLKLIARVGMQPAWARSDRVFPEVGPPDRMADWGDFLYALSQRYKGRIAGYEIWNEPNLAREWGNQPPSAADYVKLLRIANLAIRKGDPDALIISGGLSPTTDMSDRARADTVYLQEMYAAGAKGLFDLLGVHAAGFKAPPEMDPGEVAKNPELTNHDPSPEELRRAYSFRHVEDLRKIMEENDDGAHHIAILEMGWTSDPRPDSPYKWHAVTEDEKANYLARAVQYAQEHWKPWLGPMIIWTLADPSWKADQEQTYWAITSPDGTPRPAYDALKRLLK